MKNYWKMFHSRTANVCGRFCALEIGESGKNYVFGYACGLNLHKVEF